MKYMKALWILHQILTCDVESLRSEIKKEYERVAKSMNAKNVVADDKIRVYFANRLHTEILIVWEDIKCKTRQ